MDWNADGRTSIAEFLAAADTIKQPQSSGCNLYLDMKDAAGRRTLWRPPPPNRAWGQEQLFTLVKRCGATRR